MPSGALPSTLRVRSLPVCWALWPRAAAGAGGSLSPARSSRGSLWLSTWPSLCHSALQNCAGSNRTRQTRRDWRTFEWNKPLRRATRSRQPRPICRHKPLLLQNLECFAQHSRRPCVHRFYHPVMHPLPFTPGRNNPRSAQISQVPRNLWLCLAQDLHEIAYANLVSIHQVEQTKPSPIR